MVDPMLATGGSAVSGLDLLLAAGAANIRIVCIVSAPEGIAALHDAHPRSRSSRLPSIVS
jgi:uracil phosphoribosyltransferase